MAIKRISRAFKDISLSFSPHPVTKDLPILKNERAILDLCVILWRQYLLKNFLILILGQMCIKVSLILLILVLQTLFTDQIKTSIENFEPRVDNVRVEVDPQPDLNQFEVTVIYDIVGQEFPSQEYSFILEATR